MCEGFLLILNGGKYDYLANNQAGPKLHKQLWGFLVLYGQCDQMWQFVTILAIFGMLGDFFPKKSPKNGGLMSMFWGLKNLFIYCGHKFGVFAKMLVTFLSEHLVTLYMAVNK